MSERASTGSIPLSVPVLGGNEWAYVKECLDTGWVSSAGSFVTRFETAVCELTGAAHAVALVNGTAALHMALLVAGVQPGDLVIVPTLTFIATANAVRHAGADPVFVDCDEFMNIDPAGVRSFLEEACERGADGPVERASGRVVRAVVPVHVFGRPADLAALLPVAADYGLAVVEDATEALGSRWTAGPLSGRAAGAAAAGGGVYSFNGNKIITCGGGGMYVTPSAAAAARVRHLSTQAKTDTVRFVHDEAAWNYRLTNLAAALGVAQLEQLGGFIAAKRAAHDLYAGLLGDVPGVSLLGVQEGTEPNYWFISALVEPSQFGRDREGLMQSLREVGIDTRPVWGLLHEQTPFSGCTAWRVEKAWWFWQRVLNLPCSSDLTPHDVERVVAAIRAARRGY